VAVGTPGRIIDLIENERALDLSKIRCCPAVLSQQHLLAVVAAVVQLVHAAVHRHGVLCKKPSPIPCPLTYFSH
jgi:hypothetical protein